MGLRKGSRRVFDYPEGFTTLPDYTAHRGQIVTVLRELSQADTKGPNGEPTGYDVPLKANGKYEPKPWDVERMFRIQAADGWLGDAWESELV